MPKAPPGAVPGGGLAITLMPLTQRLADKLAEEIIELTFGPQPSPINPGEILDEQQPLYPPTFIPFEGGQLEGIRYNVYWEWKESRTGNYVASTSANILGPIYGSTITLAYTHPVWGPYYDFRMQTGQGEILLRQTEGNFDFARITRVERVDGQPDTGGDPPPEPIGPPRYWGPPRMPYAPAPGGEPPGWSFPTIPDYLKGNPGTSSDRGFMPLGAPMPGQLSQPGRPPYQQLDPPPLGQININLSGSLAPAPGPLGQQPLDRGFPGPIPGPGTAIETGAPPTPTITTPTMEKALLTGTALAILTSIITGLDGLPAPGQPPIPPPPQTPTTQPRCRCNIKTEGMIDGLNTLLGGAGAVADESILGKLNTINGKLGPQIAGGISGFLQGMDNFAKKAWKATKMDKVLNLLTFLTVLHNAQMLSRDIVETVGELISQGLAVIGIRDENDNALDINQAIGNQITEWLKSILGEELYTNTRSTWLAANRVYQAGANIVWSIRSVMDSTAEVIEWTAENTGKIGNALRDYGVVGERAYNRMAEDVEVKDPFRQKVNRVVDGLEGVEEAASSLYGVVSEVRDAQEEIGQIIEGRQQFAAAVSETSTAAQATFDTLKGESQSPDIEPADLVKGAT